MTRLNSTVGLMTGVFMQAMRCVLVLALLCATHARAADARVDDLAGQIEYAFYAQEREHLQQAVQALEILVAEEDSAAARIWLNYGRWKQAQLGVSGDAAAAGRAAEKCADESWSEKLPAQEQVLGHALKAACAELLAQLRPVRGVLYRHDRKQALQTALALAPKLAARLPQFQFVSAWIALHDGDVKTAYGALQRAALLYDAPDSISADGANWGQAELFYLLGKASLERREVLAARNALERALVLMPEYRDAAALLKTLSVR